MKQYNNDFTPTTTDYTVTLGYDNSLGAIAGTITLIDSKVKLLPLNEYYILPSYERNEAGEYEIISYALIHRSQAASDETMKEREN